MSFSPIYYITIACPTVERSVDMLERYIAHGAASIQVDLPSKHPVYETEFIAQCMAQALRDYQGYDVYWDALRRIRRNHRDLELHLVVYPDVVEQIGRGRFVELCGEVELASVMIAGGDDELSRFLRGEGIPVIGRIDRMLDPEQLRKLSGEGPSGICNFNYKRHKEIAPHGCGTFAKKIAYIRKAGVSCRILAVEGIANEEMMREVKTAGADGALVGNVLMRLWDDEAELWRLFQAFEALRER